MYKFRTRVMSHPYHLTVCDPPDRQEAIHNLIHAYYYYFFSFFMVIIVGIGLITRGRCFKEKKRPRGRSNYVWINDPYMYQLKFNKREIVSHQISSKINHLNFF